MPKSTTAATTTVTSATVTAATTTVTSATVTAATTTVTSATVTASTTKLPDEKSQQCILLATVLRALSLG
ncbi:unnamed protein product [Rotaria magnacalcarata]|uniref:Uncharacterized protein n=1 Tax=Rotaria magnacalcarata TaxID=392030 RepID=A0A819ZDZ1_9BILA|nr:unnamed protein product [Rotaria magnacalcarata]